MTTRTLADKTLLITGGSRGIGLAIALRAARDGANIAIAAKTDAAHPTLPGTIHTAAKAIVNAGGRALPLVCDVRDENRIADVVAATVARFGGIDTLVNNASAISLTGTLDTPMKRYDLMQQVNARATFACSQACLRFLAGAENPHILSLSPPLFLSPRWFGPHVAYTMSKYGMSMCMFGLAAELAEQGIAANGLWPRTLIATAATRVLGGEEVLKSSRRPEIMADAAHAILTRPARGCTGNFFIDEEVLRAEGVTDFTAYAVQPGEPLTPDFFVEP